MKISNSILSIEKIIEKEGDKMGKEERNKNNASEYMQIY